MIGRNHFPIDDFPFCHSGHNYALDVLEGKIPSCIYVIGACKRYISDLQRSDICFNAIKAEKYLRLVQKFPHVIGKWPTENIVYAPWQNFCFMNIRGFFLKESGNPRYRTVHIEVSRGSGKSAMASQAALYDLALDSPNGNQISVAATKKDQARIVLDSAREMAKKSKSYLKKTGVKVLAHKIVHEKSNSHVVALSSETNSNDGRADKLAICDELHAMNKKTFEVVDSGMSKRPDSLLLCITTAGYDIDGVGSSQSLYAKKVCLGEVEDDTFFALVYTIDKDDDPWDESSWRKANPNLGISVDPVNFTAKAKKAQANPQDSANFKIKHLNIWIGEAQAFFDIDAWDKCADESLKIEDFKGYKCFTGVDLASKVDLTSFVHIFKKDGTYYIFDRTYLPEGTLKEAKNSLYEKCQGLGYLKVTPGNAINLKHIQSELLQDSNQFKIAEVLYDPWNATEFAQNLSKERIEMVEFRMNTSNLSEATKTLGAWVKEGKIRHNGSPLLRWCFGNVVCKEDVVGNVFPKKSHEKLKIDIAIATIMAVAAWIGENSEETVYEVRGIRTL